MARIIRYAITSYTVDCRQHGQGARMMTLRFVHKSHLEHSLIAAVMMMTTKSIICMNQMVVVEMPIQ